MKFDMGSMEVEDQASIASLTAFRVVFELELRGGGGAVVRQERLGRSEARGHLWLELRRLFKRHVLGQGHVFSLLF